MTVRTLKDYVGGAWIPSLSSRRQALLNPATEELLAEVPLGGAEDVSRAVDLARAAFAKWRRTPVEQRIQPLFKLKALLEEHFEEIATVITRENGKTLSEARGSLRRGIECVEVATGAPSLLQGQTLEDVGPGIDCATFRQPLGVCAAITPFNFPAMVPLWFAPFAVACGNTFLCKPSEQVPQSQEAIFRLIDRAGFPPGVLNLINGGREMVDAILTHPGISAVSFVGSTQVAQHIYSTSAAAGKRVQALGGAKNFVVVMPDAEFEAALDACSASSFGCAGERCLAGSVVIAVADKTHRVREGLSRRARALRLGNGEDAATDMGPLISAAHRERVLRYLEIGQKEGASLLVDGRTAKRPEKGFFLGASLFADVRPEMVIAKEEIFGPILVQIEADTLDMALEIIHKHPLANAASIFTQSGRSAWQFKYNVPAAMCGINIGVAAPMAFFSFGGSRRSFFGDLKAHGRDAFDFYTDKKVVISRFDAPI